MLHIYQTSYRSMKHSKILLILLSTMCMHEFLQLINLGFGYLTFKNSKNLHKTFGLGEEMLLLTQYRDGEILDVEITTSPTSTNQGRGREQGNF